MNALQRIVRRLRTEWRGVAPSYWADRASWGSWSALVPGGTIARAGIPVDEDTALTLTAAYAAINVISSDVAMLPLKVYRRRRDGRRDRVLDHPVTELLAISPDGETTACRWRQALTGHVLGWGNGYAEITFAGGRPSGLYLLDPKRTRAERRPQDNHLFYRHGTGTLPRDRVLHVAGLSFDGLSGYSPIRLAREAIALGLAAEYYGAAFFGNQARPSGVLRHPSKLSAEAQARLRESWEALHNGAGAHRTAVLSEGMEFQSITVPPEDAQFLATRQFQVVEIARMYRLPPHKLGDYSQSHLANIEASNIDYLTTTLMPWLGAIEDEFTRKLFTPEERARGFYCEHDANALLRGDITSRFGAYSVALRDGWLNRDDVRERENLNPIGEPSGGRIYTVQAQMVPLGQLGAPAAPQAQASRSEPEGLAMPSEHRDLLTQTGEVPGDLDPDRGDDDGPPSP
jgi:HK97 family phage portal protein